MNDQNATALTAGALSSPCDASQFSFQTTAELPDVDVVAGQTRAIDAIQFGLRIPGDGYNIFALGPRGVGKLTTTRQLVSQEALRSHPLSDWCYVYNFDQPHKPNAIKLPPGEGTWLRSAMAQLIEDLRAALPAAFESEDYRNRAEELDQSLKNRQREATEKVATDARAQNIALMHTATGYAFAPVDESGSVVTPDDFQKLPEAERKRIEETIQQAQKALQKALREVPKWVKQARETMKQVTREISESVVTQLIAELKNHFATSAEILNYLLAVEADVIENVAAFLPQAENRILPMAADQHEDALQRYAVNLLVANEASQVAPVIYEDLPSYTNLLGRTEYQAQMGTLVTNFTLIKAGALHRANGGYLVLDARQVLMQPLAWDGLKRSLLAQEIRLDSLERSYSFVSTVSLEPEPIPLKVKVILLGDRDLYYLLSRYDPEFIDLFKVMADFDDVMDRRPPGDLYHASLFATLSRRNELRPLSPDAVARLTEHTSRLAGDSDKASTHIGQTVDLLREADHWAADADQEVIQGEQIQRAIDQSTYRAERIRERIYESIEKGAVLIDLDGRAIGQVNGLSVIELGQFRFGQPTRITATTRPGDGKVIDIERETRLGGPIHSKGVLILASFLAARYSQTMPLSISASLVFEQSYGMVEGDSASLAELCAIISSLARRPISQCWAVTGSVNQHGQVQPIGGVNEKIEGFFDVCSRFGLTGEQGVIIPKPNVRNLMLRDDVVQAVKERRFAVHAVSKVDQAIELLMNQPAGDSDLGGKFPAETINGLVQRRLAGLVSQRLKATRNTLKVGKR